MKSEKKYQTIKATPDASSMIETFRAVGYSFETAVADIVDNSISANARNIWFDYIWKGENTEVCIKDDGYGMNHDELVQAMRPGSKHPLEERSLKDLGRFGLGLKTASFSQTRKFSLLSKKGDFKAVYWAWDLDHVNKTQEWELIKYIPDNKYLTVMEKMSSGTMVLWYELDRLLTNIKEDDDEALSKFMELMDSLKKHLSMVFHRFIEQGKINIYFQNRKISAWDPYLRKENGVQPMPEEHLSNGLVTLSGYVLPHKSKISEETFRSASGLKGWNAQQGFYIYRNERLLVAGDWLGMFRKEEHYKLARIMIDLPNTLDNDWQIDIKKSIARPPLKIRNQLKAYANDVRACAVQVYRHRGKIIQRKFSSSGFVPVWLEKIRHGKRFYKLNREHPVIKDFIDEIKNNELNNLFRFIEETIPIPLITIRESEEPELPGLPFEGINHELLKEKIKECFNDLLSQDLSVDSIINKLLQIEPFDKYPEYIELLKEEVC